MNAAIEATIRYRRDTDLGVIIQSMIDDGCDPADARKAVLRVHNRLVNEKRDQAIMSISAGALLIVGGGVVFFWTYLGGVPMAKPLILVAMGLPALGFGANALAEAGQERARGRAVPDMAS